MRAYVRSSALGSPLAADPSIAHITSQSLATTVAASAIRPARRSATIVAVRAAAVASCAPSVRYSSVDLAIRNGKIAFAFAASESATPAW